MVRCSRAGRVTEFREKPSASTFRFASLGIYLFRRDALLAMLGSDRTDIVFDIIMPWLAEGQVAGYAFKGYWEDIGSISSYYSASLQLLKNRSLVTDPDWPIFTKGSELPPARCSEGSCVTDSIIGDGCVVKGEVRGSILSPGVVVEKGALVEDSIVFSFSRIGQDARVRKAILDKFVAVGSGSRIGADVRREEGSRRSTAAGNAECQTGGIAVIGRRARIARGASVPKGMIVEPHSRVGGGRQR
jgi:glucose-1-phosphate adenylyltransferase